MSAIVWSERPEHNAWEGRRNGVLVAHVQVVADAVAFRWWTRGRKWSGCSDDALSLPLDTAAGAR